MKLDTVMGFNKHTSAVKYLYHGTYIASVVINISFMQLDAELLIYCSVWYSFSRHRIDWDGAKVKAKVPYY